MVQGLTNKDAEERTKDRKGNSKRIVINRTYLNYIDRQKDKLFSLLRGRVGVPACPGSVSKKKYSK